MAASRFTRREVLIGGAALVASPFVLGPNHAPGPHPLVALAASPGRRLGVRYALGTDGITAAESLAAAGDPSTRLVDAFGSGSGHRSLRDGASVRLAGLAGPVPAAAAAQLDFLVAGAGTGLVPFYAWTRDRGSESPATNVVVGPPGSGPAFGLAGRVPGDAPGAWQEATAVFTTGRERSMAKLRPGAYVVEIAPGASVVAVVSPL